jgi:hypothetical protein
MSPLPIREYVGEEMIGEDKVYRYRKNQMVNKLLKIRLTSTQKCAGETVE